MDKLEKYSRILRETVERHAKFQPANGNIKTFAVVSETNDSFMVVDAGWSEKMRRVYDVVLHFRLENGKVIVERDNTDAEVVRELLEKGVAQTDVILAFNDEPYRELPALIAA